MRILLSLPLLSLVAAAPRQSSTSNSVAQWGEAVGRWSAWFQMSSPPPQEVVNSFRYDDENMNIYDKLKDVGEYKKLLKIINIDKDVVSRLKDRNREMTLLAPNDEAFQYFMDPFGLLEDDRDDDKKRREYKQRMAREFVLYHILDMKIVYKQFGQNSTLATALRPHDGTFGGHHRRVKVEGSMLPSKVVFNNYATISQQDIGASNGVIQKLDRPLFPPPDIMDQLYMFPKMFSYSSVGYLKVDLQDELEYNTYNHPIGQGRSDRDRNTDKRHKGYGVTTVIVPSNTAWEKLPQDLQFYLFSPFGERALRKLLEFHTIPDYTVFTELVEKDRSEHGRGLRCSDKVWYDDRDDESFEWKRTFPTLMKQDIEVYSKKTKNNIPGSNGYNWDLRVHGIEVSNRDNVAQNGAIQLIDTVLSPRGKGGHDEQQTQRDWNEWKEWLIDWVGKEHRDY